jgi:hypothetical protein
VRFLRRREAPPPGPDPQPGTPSATDAVAIFGSDSILEGRIPFTERRLSDALNAGDPLHVQVGESREWTVFDLDPVVAVAPPTRADPSSQRMARRRHAVELSAGRYVIEGTAHMPPGADPMRYVDNTSLRWLPLTHCTVRTAEDDWSVEVLVVNLEHVRRTRRASPETSGTPTAG